MKRGPATALRPALLALADLASAIPCPWVLIGGIATTLLGEPRRTVDVDALAWLDLKDLDAFLAAGARFGFSPRVPDAIAFARSRRMLLLRHDPSGVPVDISLGGLPFESEMIERRRTIRIEGRLLPYPTPEDFVIAKAVAHRPIDLEDIRKVASLNPRMDTRRVERWVRKFAETLEEPAIWEDLAPLLKAAKRRKR